MASERGLVVSCPVEFSSDSMFVKSTNLDPQELRFALLFWDKLNFPTNNIVNVGISGDTQFLVDSGIVERLRVDVRSGGSGSNMFYLAHMHAFKTLDSKDPGVWSLATGERSMSLVDGEEEVGKGVLVRLHQAIPIPDKDVPIQDILDFRTRRRSELLTLRHHLEDIYQRVIHAGDGPMALNTEIEKLGAAIADHIKTHKEAGIRLRHMSFDARINLLPGVGAFVAALAMQMPTIASLITGAAASINIGPSASMGAVKATGTPYRYISRYHDEIL